jgi:hypothetical protein
MSECEISKDRTWVNQYSCSTHGVWFRDSNDCVECCPAGEIEDEFNKVDRYNENAYEALKARNAELNKDNNKLREEIRRLRKGEECHVARPGEGTYECRIDKPCPACRLRVAEEEISNLRIKLQLKTEDRR